MTTGLILAIAIVVGATIIICGWIHRTRDRDARAWAQELLDNGLRQIPDDRVCAICGRFIHHDERVEYCRHDVCHAICYHNQVET